MRKPPVVRLDDVVVRADGRTVLGPISLHISADDRWVFLGPNGCGKTTLASVIGARLQPSAGTAEVLGITFGRGDLRRLGERIGSSSHAVSDRFSPGISVVDVVLTGKRSALAPWLQGYDEADRTHAMASLADVGSADLASRSFGSCSQGERQRVLLARAMFGDPDLLILDEPSAGLDLSARERLLTAIDSGFGRRPFQALVFTTHHLEEIPRTISHAALLRGGRLVASGPIDQVLTDGPVSTCFDLPVEVERRRGRWFASTQSLR